MDYESKRFVMLLLCGVAVYYIQGSKLDGPTSERVLMIRRQMECVEEVRVEPELVMNVRNGKWAEDELLKQWALCVLMKAGLMTREGVYRLDVPMSQAPKEHKDHIESMIDKCLSQKAKPAPVIAYNFIKCYQQISKGNFSFASVL